MTTVKKIVCLLGLVFCACNTYMNGFTIYSISKDHHFCKGWRLGITTNPYRHYVFSMDKNCLYDTTKYPSAWNKICGFTVLHTHWNSCRVGWQIKDGKIALGYYCYVKRERIAGILDETLPGELNDVKCFWDKNKRGYVININSNEAFIPQPKRSLYYLYTYPFFGGRYRTDHTMSISVKNVEGGKGIGKLIRTGEW